VSSIGAALDPTTQATRARLVASAGEPLVDVGIPTCGRPDYLVEAITSVLGQTLGRWRLTVSEDGPGSDAVAAAVAPHLRDGRVRYAVTGRRLGAARHMTRLIRGGTAPYVALLHDDDRWEPDFLARRVAFLEAHEECALVFSGGKVIDARGRVTGTVTPQVSAGVWQSRAFAPRMLRRNLVPTTTVLVRRRAYAAAGMAYDDRFPHIYDYEMWLRLAVRFPVGCLPEADAHWRNHGAQSSFDGRRRGDEQLRFLAHAEALVTRELPEVRIPAQRRRYLHGRRLLSAGLDAVEDGRSRPALAYLGRALRAFPPLAVNPRLVVALLGLAGGARCRRAIGSTRVGARRRGVRMPL
jgi:glycosyltransferase involved in cell wall biosynthesis